MDHVGGEEKMFVRRFVVAIGFVLLSVKPAASNAPQGLNVRRRGFTTRSAPGMTY